MATATSAPPASIHLYGSVKDQSGNPIPAYVEVIDMASQVVGSTYTEADGTYDLVVPGRQSLALTANPLNLPEQLIEIEGGFRLSRYFELTKAIDPSTDEVEASFVLPPAAALWLWAYTSVGERLLMGDLYSQINPPYWSYDDVYGAFPMDSIGLSVFTEASIGKLRGAWHPEKEWSQYEPCFAVPPGEAVFLMMPWPVPGIGFVPLRADNRGAGYTVGVDEVAPINLVYDFAETEYRRAQELKAGYEAQGYVFSVSVTEGLSQASDDLNEARGQTDRQSQALLSYPVLERSIRAKEQMTLEVADKGIEARKDEWTVAVRDEAGNAAPNVGVSYRQSASDFVLSYGNYLPFGAFLYPSFKAGKEMGFEYLYDQAVTWKSVSPAEGVYDFSEHDALLERARVEGWEAVASLSWLGPDVIPDWALNLELSEFKQHLREFVKKAVEHYRGKVKYLTVVHEPATKSRTGTRYVDLQYKSSYAWALQIEEQIDLMRAALEAAREVDSEILFGFSMDPDYMLYLLNPGSFGLRFCPYSLLKMALESGVRPDWIGVEFGCSGWLVPLDLSTVAGILQAYHDLSGLPVLITEMFPNSSETEDYGMTGPAPGVYWHEGLTQQAQAEWATSVAKIALGLPYVLGLNMMHAQPDLYGDGLLNIPGIGTDYITNDFQRKKVYYATKDLFESWRGAGSGVTGADGNLRFDGLAGTYAMTLTTPGGLIQTFETHLGPESTGMTVTLDTAAAIGELRDLVSEAQRKLDWCQHLGRALDHTGLRALLEQARNALASGEYGNARAQAQTVLDAAAITIDGNPGDWQGIPPIATAAPGGVQVDAPGIDLKALYGMTDDEYLYLMVAVYDPPISIQPGLPLGSLVWPQFLFDLQTGQGRRHHVRTYLPYGGQMDVYRTTEPSGILATLYTLAYGEVLEFKVPLALLDNPSHISVCGFVLAAENGSEKGAKGFECYVDVLSPDYSIYLPMFAVR